MRSALDTAKNMPEIRLKYWKVICAGYRIGVKVLTLSFSSWSRGKVRKGRVVGRLTLGTALSHPSKLFQAQWLQTILQILNQRRCQAVKIKGCVAVLEGWAHIHPLQWLWKSQVLGFFLVFHQVSAHAMGSYHIMNIVLPFFPSCWDLQQISLLVCPCAYVLNSCCTQTSCFSVLHNRFLGTALNETGFVQGRKTQC